MFRIENAPRLNEDTDEEVVQFIDKYVSCDLPGKEVDSELKDIISSNVQMHSRRHSKSCRKKKTECRFNFPRPQSERTFVTRKETLTMDSQENEDDCCKISLDGIGKTPDDTPAELLNQYVMLYLMKTSNLSLCMKCLNPLELLKQILRKQIR